MNVHQPINIRVARLRDAMKAADEGNLTNAALAIASVKDDEVWSIEDREQLQAAYEDALRGDAMSCLDYLELVAYDDCPVGCLE